MAGSDSFCLGSVFSFELDSSFLSEAVTICIDGVCLKLGEFYDL